LIQSAPDVQRIKFQPFHRANKKQLEISPAMADFVRPIFQGLLRQMKLYSRAQNDTHIEPNSSLLKRANKYNFLGKIQIPGLRPTVKLTICELKPLESPINFLSMSDEKSNINRNKKIPWS
jgi:hypothetical protein